MIKAIIVEDEQKNIRILKKMIEAYCPDIEICGEAETVTTAYHLIKSKMPELVFLDIEIPGGNAFALLDKLFPVNFEIIFITAFDHYALKAIRYSALDYLLKPLSIDDLIMAVEKATKKLKNTNINELLLNFLQNSKIKKKELQSIALPTKNGFEIFHVNEIIRCQTENRFTAFYLTGKRKMLSEKSLKEYEEIFPHEFFFRAHHAHLINIGHVKLYHKGKTVVIEMKDGTSVPLALRRKNDFIAIFHNPS